MVETNIKPHLSDYLVDGQYVLNGDKYDDPCELLQNGILGFGMSYKVGDCLTFIMWGLALVEKRSKVYREAKGDISSLLADRLEDEQQYFNSDGVESFFYHWCVSEELVDYGTSLPGWLTEDGENLLSLLRECDALP